MDSRAVIRAILAEGWREVRVTGSHHHVRYPTRPGTVTVPHPKKDIAPGTLRSIARQSGAGLKG
jgi:predicted RNA binding protein YcfA (HicA-like mRNA interferase family)